MRFFTLSVALLCSLALSQANTWTLLNQGQTGGRTRGALVYHPDSGRFLLTIGVANDSAAYSDLMYSDRNGKWINFFPADTLYGVWGDSTGRTRGQGRMGTSVFTVIQYYFGFQAIPQGGTTYLRPNLHHYREGAAFRQYAYNPLDGKTYYFVNNQTFTYDARLRRWDTLRIAVNPGSMNSNQTLRFGVMAHDPIHNEFIAAGGGVDRRNGWSGTWIFSPSARTWAPLNAAVEPPGRAYAGIATDPVRGKIVFFGGDHLDYLMADTWVYDCATRTWERKHPAKSPSPRAGHALVYLPKTGKIALLGGYGYPASGLYAQLSPFEMWTYDLDADEWRLNKAFTSGERAPSCLMPAELAAAADTSDRVLVLGRADTTFAMNCDPSVVDAAGTLSRGVADDSIFYHPDPWRPAWFDNGVAAPDTAANEAFLASLVPNVWTNVVSPKKPASNHDWGTTVYDPDHDLILKFTGGHSAHCGNEVDHYSPHDNRWHISYVPEWPLEYNGDAGLPFLFSFNGRPMVTHSYDNYCYDTIHHRLVYVKPFYTFFYNPETMSWDSVIPNPSAFPTDYHRISVNFSSRGPTAWVLRSGTSTVFDFYLLDPDSLRWRLLPRTGELFPDYYCDIAASVYDSRRDRMLFFSHSDSSKVWSYEFTTGVLSKTSPQGRPFTGYRRESIYIPELDIVFTQGDKAYHCDTDQWEWLTLALGTGVSGNNTVSSGYMVDTKRKLIWDSESYCYNFVLKLTAEAFAGLEGRVKSAVQPVLEACPNPFNPSVRISLGRDPRETGSLEIFNAAGKRMFSRPISRSLTWNASDAPSGLYILRVRADGRTSIKNITLVK